MTKVFNQVLITQTVPENWKKADIILIYKKGDKHKIENYRPIILGITFAKICSKLIKTSIQKRLQYQQPREQAEFRKSYSTIDPLYFLNQIIEKSNEYQFPIYIAFLDYTKAFNSVKHEFMFQSLKNQGLPDIKVNIIKDTYNGAKARIITDLEGEYFEIKSGVKQGDPRSPILFNCTLEEIFRRMEWEGLGLDVNGEKLTNLRFADDVILITSERKQLNRMIDDLNKQGRVAGLNINMEKSKILTTENDMEILIDNVRLETVEEIIYLGQNISFKDR